MRRRSGQGAIVAAGPAVGLALAAAALAWPGGELQRSHGRALAVAASGQMRVTTSRGEAAVLSAPALAPGGEATGSVTIHNRGHTGSLLLRARNLSERPGPDGGSLGSALRLAVTDVTAGSDATVYSGLLARMPTLRLGLLSAGTKRRYRFTAALPEPGIVDNALAAAAIDFDYSWKLSGAVPAHCSVLLSGDAAGNRIVGTAGSDRIRGFAGADEIRAGRGDDCVIGGRGRDRIDCGPGADAARTDPGDVVRSCERRL
jgi:hypothetical protein